MFNFKETFSCSSLSKNSLLIALLVCATLLRAWAFPSYEELRDGDEVGYVTGGLMAWEGLLPGWRAVPAGPQTWTGWIFIAGRSTWEGSQLAKGVPLVLKPFVAIDRALFDTYADLGFLKALMLGISLLVSLAAVLGGFRLGSKYGGPAGGVLIGGVVAILPIFVEYSGIAKSCSDAWMLAILAVSCAATISRLPGILSGIMLGFAIASRIDMVLATPLVIWGLWDNPACTDFFRTTLKTAAAMALTTFVVAPWAVLGFLGLLRTVAMARVSGYWTVDSPRLTTLRDLLWGEGLGPILLVTVAGFCLPSSGTRVKRISLAVYAALLLSTMFTGHYQPMRYHGAPLVALLVAAAISAGGLLQRKSRLFGIVLAVLLLALPLIQSVRRALDSFHAPEASTDWIEKHVPPGTIVYLHINYTSKAILPTEASADAIWHAVAGDQAWRIKLQEGLSRFGLQERELPRALSEDNLCMDRSVCRRWFILGGSRGDRPRYDVRPISIGKTFRIDNMSEEMKKTGGVLVWRTEEGIVPVGLGEPVVKWLNRKGNGTLIFVSNDVLQKLTR